MSSSKFFFHSKKDSKFVLLGSGLHLCYLANLLVKNKFPKPIIVTQPKKYHRRDKFLLKDKKIYKDIFKEAKKLNLKIIESNNCNNNKIIDLIKKNDVNFAFSLSCRNILNKNFLSQFKHTFNIHPSFLPNEKGGGTFSWRILNNSKEISATIHMVNEKIDDGKILFQTKKFLKGNNLNPSKYLINTNKLYCDLLDKFINTIINKKPFFPKNQLKNDSYYLPRLNTEKNGFIDWSWEVNYISRFIKAFSNPYPGANTFLKNKKIIIKNAVIKKYIKDLHPYCFGRVINISKKYYEVLCNGGILKISKSKKYKIKTSDILHTPEKILLNSKKIYKVKNFNQKLR